MAAIHAISKGQLRMQLNEVAGNAVAVYPAFRKVLGLNAAAAQFLSQAVYWAERTNDGWFYKTEAEWQDEIGLVPDEVRDARKNLKAFGILDEQRKGIPAKMFFRINADVLMAALAGDVQEVSLEQVLTIHRTKLTQLSKTGLMRATKLGVKAEYVDYAAVLEKHGMVCGCCGKAIVRSPGKGGQHLSFDHIIPLAAGGTHVFDNLQPAHASCNGAKGSKVLASATRTISLEKSSSSTVVELEVLQKKHKQSSAKPTITETTQRLRKDSLSEPAPTDPRQLVEMTLSWKPDYQQLEPNARLAMVSMDRFTDDVVGSFVVHHAASGSVKTNAQWLAALVAWVKREKVKADASGGKAADETGVPVDQIIDLYHRVCPNLPRVIVTTDKTLRGMIVDRWNEAEAHRDGKGFWLPFFEKANNRSQVFYRGQNVVPRLEALVSRAVFREISEAQQ